MRRSTKFKCVKKEAEFLLLLLFVYSQKVKYLLLYVRLVNTDRAASQFDTV